MNKIRKMSTSEIITIGFGFVGIIGAIIGIYVRVMMAITAQQTEICGMKKNFDDHKNENNNMFSEIAKVLEKVSELHMNVVSNTERIISITQQFDEHKEQNDKSFIAISELVKQNRQDNKEEHQKMVETINDGQKQLINLLIKQN